MKKSGAVLFLLLLTALFEPAEVQAAEPLAMELKPEGLYVDNVNVPVLQKMFADYGYKDYIYMPEWKYPPLFLNSLPEDFAKTEDKSFRNRLFIQILAPLALLVNERITLERYPLLLMRERLDKGEKLTAEDKKELERLAEKYDVFTRMKGDGRYEILLAELLNRADEVPPSFLIAAAAAESNRGTAREVRLGNALYKRKVWYTEEGIKPLEDPDDSYRIKTYPTLLAAMEDYALIFNSDVNFAHFRDLRRQRRNHDKPLRGNAMAYNMVRGSPLENYAGLISYIITFYDLVNLDEAELGSVNMFWKKKE